MTLVSVYPTQNAFNTTATAEKLTGGFLDLESNCNQNDKTFGLWNNSAQAEILRDDSTPDIEKGVFQNVMSYFVSTVVWAILMPFADDFTKSAV